MLLKFMEIAEKFTGTAPSCGAAAEQELFPRAWGGSRGCSHLLDGGHRVHHLCDAQGTRLPWVALKFRLPFWEGPPGPGGELPTAAPSSRQVGKRKREILITHGSKIVYSSARIMQNPLVCQIQMGRDGAAYTCLMWSEQWGAVSAVD